MIMGNVLAVVLLAFLGWDVLVHTFKGDMVGSVDASGRFRTCWRDL